MVSGYGVLADAYGEVRLVLARSVLVFELHPVAFVDAVLRCGFGVNQHGRFRVQSAHGGALAMFGVEEAPGACASREHQGVLLGKLRAGYRAFRWLFVVCQRRQAELDHLGTIEVVATR